MISGREESSRSIPLTPSGAVTPPKGQDSPAAKSKSPSPSKLVYNSEETEPVDLWNENARLEVGDWKPGMARRSGEEGARRNQQGEKNAKHHKSLSLCFPSFATALSPLRGLLRPGTFLPPSPFK